MKYLSFFSGIGGFEMALHSIYGESAKCIGYSEVKPAAIKVYQHHFPEHKNLGDITKITTEQITEIIKQIKIKKLDERDGSYDYLINLPIHSLSKETYNKYKKEYELLKKELVLIKKKSIVETWKEDIQEALEAIEQQNEILQKKVDKDNKSSKKTKSTKKK